MFRQLYAVHGRCVDVPMYQDRAILPPAIDELHTLFEMSQQVLSVIILHRHHHILEILPFPAAHSAHKVKKNKSWSMCV